MTKFKTTLVATFDVPGWHRWPSPPVRFKNLRHPHRHLFHFRVHLRVEGDRQIEFISVADQGFKVMLEYFDQRDEECFYREGVDASCETLAKILLLRLQAGWPEVFRVECWEDRENGAVVEVEE